MHTLAHGRAARRRGEQAGFSLVEVSIVTAIVLLIAVIGIPAIGGYVMENKVPKVGQELARFIMHVRVNAGTSGDAPYEDIGTANLAAMAADSSVLTVASDGTVLHGLGGGGAVEIESADAGAAFLLRLKQVNHVACPSIASVLQRVADRITVEAGGGTARTVKDETTAYNALTAESACAKGDVNQFVFHVS
ncbi:type II secretion system protein [Castellaniella defragrans]|jgi:prepilin-type N-terminal cleavage/methylation domain-containing protein|uniref:Prepilin-type N-terminal cleavage/methylation domain-containing protein n=2 Tax=Castellaniella defragrans TaxID=75697 RepID=A0A7W9WNY9_CASDE|nr:type II secretion system protein [Castellaniella defragrans]KAB0615093.1 prepilin-type N-terminal cleavage/methylation domain-containing protein [Castellaniella defragrans]MBB6083914.1 prepilin-type N-terminal cleavage/methylation domain-containing protein [Castellaniella defragrans]CDM24099.1 putative fimbrial protein [Castellaniella defragrans 65Phen]